MDRLGSIRVGPFPALASAMWLSYMLLEAAPPQQAGLSSSSSILNSSPGRKPRTCTLQHLHIFLRKVRHKCYNDLPQVSRHQLVGPENDGAESVEGADNKLHRIPWDTSQSAPPCNLPLSLPKGCLKSC